MSRNHKDKYENSNPRRMYTLMCPEDYQSGKKSHWSELEITGSIRNLSPNLWQMTHLTALYLNDNSLQRVPCEIGRLINLRILDLSNNKLRSLPAELGELIYLRYARTDKNNLRNIHFSSKHVWKFFFLMWNLSYCFRELLLNQNYLRVLPYELGKLFQLQVLGLQGNPLSKDVMTLYGNGEGPGTNKLLTYMLDNLQGKWRDFICWASCVKGIRMSSLKIYLYIFCHFVEVNRYTLYTCLAIMITNINIEQIV